MLLCTFGIPDTSPISAALRRYVPAAFVHVTNPKHHRIATIHHHPTFPKRVILREHAISRIPAAKQLLLSQVPVTPNFYPLILNPIIHNPRVHGRVTRPPVNSIFSACREFSTTSLKVSVSVFRVPRRNGRPISVIMLSREE